MIRRAELSDAIDIYNIELACFTHNYSLSTIQSDLESDRVMIFVCEENNKIVGYISIYYFLDEANLQKIAVLENYRRKGIASQLIKFAESELLSKNVGKFYLEVNEHNLIAISVYEKLGFEKISTRNNYYGSDAAVILQKELK